MTNQGWRNVFTTGPAKLDPKDYAIKCMGGPNWATDYNLRANGLYYEGFLDDLESLLDYHKVITVTMYGTQKSRKVATVASLGNDIEGKENESPEKQKYEQEEVILYKAL